jgi:hypothetical protein
VRPVVQPVSVEGRADGGDAGAVRLAPVEFRGSAARLRRRRIGRPVRP